MDFQVESIIEYTDFLGGTRRVQVTEVHDDIKNGRPGFDGFILSTGEMVWGYASQVTDIVTI